MAENETIELTTDGGFTGRGIGSVRIEGTKLSVNGRFVRDLTPSQAAGFARLAAAVSDFAGSATSPDAIAYRLQAGEHTITWRDSDRLPRPAQNLFEAVWTLLVSDDT